VKNLILFIFIGLSLTGCSLDKEYFDQTKTSAYSLSTDVIANNLREEVSFTSGTETLYGIFANPDGVNEATPAADRITIIYFHARDKNIDKYWPRVESLFKLNSNGLPVNVFIFDYQGFGKSTGKPSIAALKRNSLAALNYVKSRADVNDDLIVYYAYSFGGIFAIDLGGNQNQIPAALITESIPHSAGRTVAIETGVQIPDSFLLNEGFNNYKSLKKIAAPTLMFHGQKDETVPYKKNFADLFSAARSPKESVIVPNGGHSDLIAKRGEDTYIDDIRDFLNANVLN